MRRTTWRAWLEGHLPGDEVEAGHLRRILDVLRGADDPLSRSSFAPGHLTASGFVVDPAGEALLLVHHRTLGRWLQPGGHVEDADVDPVAAARREVEEETGLRDVELLPGFPRALDVDVHAIPENPRRGEPAHLHLDVRVLFRSRTRDLAASEEVAGARWVPFDEVVSAGADASVLRALGRLRARVGPTR